MTELQLATEIPHLTSKDVPVVHQGIIKNEPMVQEPEGEDVEAEKDDDLQVKPGQVIDFSKLDFSAMSAQDLEKMYIDSVNQASLNQAKLGKETDDSKSETVPSAKRANSMYNPTTMPTPTNGFSFDNHPTTMMVHLESISLHKPIKNFVLRFSFRHRKFKTNSTLYPNGHSEEKFKFDLSYHSLLFDHLKVDVYEGGFFGSHVGRAHIRLARLPQALGDIEYTYALKHRKAYSSRKRAAKQIGEITIGFSFIGESRARRSTRNSRPSTSSSNGPLSPSPEMPGGRERSNTNVFPVDQGTPEHQVEVDEFIQYFKEARQGDMESLYDGDDSKSVISMRTITTIATTNTTTETKRKRTLSLFSDNTRKGLQEFGEIAAAMFGTGWKLSKPEFVRAMMFVQKYYAKYHPNPRTNDVVTEERQLRVAAYFFNYSMAAYGSLILNYFGYGKGYVRDFLRPKMDSKTAREHLGLKKSDMLVWDFELKLFKPQFFIARDPKLNAIVVVIRGTNNIHECIVDAFAEYEPFSHGYAHRGFLRCAQYLEVHYLERIKAWIQQYKCSALYLTAHSLGAGVSALFTMILSSHLDELRELSGNSKFKLKCYNMATAPCVNAELCEEFEPYIDTYVFENDIVPRASFGAVFDFRELIITAHHLLKEKRLSTQERMNRLAARHTELKESNEHPKVYIPGRIFYIYKTSRVNSSTTKRPPKADEINQDALTGNPLVDDMEPHYLVERSKKELFCNIAFKTNFLIHHFPNKYDAGLRKAHDYIQEHRDLIKELD